MDNARMDRMKIDQAVLDRVRKIFKTFAASNPNPKIELNYLNPYTLLIAVVLSARMTDKGVNKATAALFSVCTTPREMVLLGEDKLKEYIKTIGLYPTKSKNIIALSEILLEQYNGTVPNNINDLIKLPGVGRKSANVILNTIFKKNTMPVDTHVGRVSKRLGFVHNADNVNTIEEKLTKIIPNNILGKAHHWMVLHGRYVCKSQKPQCSICIVSSLCTYRIDTLTHRNTHI